MSVPTAGVPPTEAQRRALYDAEIAFMDRQVARLVARLEQHGVLDNTLVVVIADHGDAYYEASLETSGGDLARDVVLVLALACVGVALLGPRVGEKQVRVPVTGVDVVVLVDEVVAIDSPEPRIHDAMNDADTRHAM